MEIPYDVFVQNFRRNLIKKEVCKSVDICQSCDQKSSVLYFFDLQCMRVSVFLTNNVYV